VRDDDGTAEPEQGRPAIGFGVEPAAELTEPAALQQRA
jgi:hypothetical protein